MTPDHNTMLGIRGDLRADGDSCDSCGLPLHASPLIERIAGPIVDERGRACSGDVVFLFGECVCGAGWGLVWRMDP
jgi:hypothetical protein